MGWCAQASLEANGLSGVNVTLNATTSSESATCMESFDTYCLDNTRLTRADVIGIIVAGFVFIALVVAMCTWLLMRHVRKSTPKTPERAILQQPQSPRMT